MPPENSDELQKPEGQPLPPEKAAEDPAPGDTTLDPYTLQQMTHADLGSEKNLIDDELISADTLSDDSLVRPGSGSPVDSPAADLPVVRPPDAAEAGPASGPMTQAEVEALLTEQKARPRGDELDALVAEAQAHPPAIRQDLDAADLAETPLTQEMLDALTGASPSGAQAEAPQEAPDSDEALSQAALDALLASTEAAAASGDAPAEDGTDEPLSQEALDALLASPEATATSDDAPEEDGTDELLSQEALDALLASPEATAASDDAPEEDGTDEPLSQEALDALLASPEAAAASGDAPAEAGTDEPLSQEALDALLASPEASAAAVDPVQSAETPAPDGGDEAITQDAIDALLGAADADGDDSVLDQDDIDAILGAAGGSENQPLDTSDLDSLLTDAEAPDSESVDQSSIDALISGLGVDDEEAPADDGDEGVSQDMVDALIASAQGGQERPASVDVGSVGAENLAAAATTPDAGGPLLTQEDLDALMERAEEEQGRRQHERRKAIEEAIAAATSGKPSAEDPPVAPRPPGPVRVFLGKHAIRMIGSIAAGLVVALSTFSALELNTERVPDFAQVRVAAADELELAMARARELMGTNEFRAAAEGLEKPIAAAAPGPLRDDARYLQVEARCRAFEVAPRSGEVPELLSAIDKAVAAARNHEMAPQALYWKAKIYEYDQLPQAARNTYDEIIRNYPAMPRLDEVYMAAGRLAMEMGEALPAAQHARALIREFPGSRHYSEARLLLGDANELAGSYEDARTLYLRVAREERDTRTGADAFLKLGRLAYMQRNYDDAALQLETRLTTATTSEGNDQVYLLLAQCYRQLDRLDHARHALEDLLSFFPDSPAAPGAYIELSQVLDEMGLGEEALKTANLAAVKYRDDPRVLRNKGDLLGQHGNPYGAALALMAAHEAGARDPVVLLDCARYFHVAKMLDDAHEAYQLLAREHGATAQALTGNIEDAKLLYEMGRPDAAVSKLEALAQATRDPKRRLNTLQALADMYRDFNLNDRVAELSREIIQASDEPEDLARAAAALLAAGDVETGIATLKRVAPARARVKNDTAYRMYQEAGRAMRGIDPRQSLQYLEQAAQAYPRSRTLEDDQLLLSMYLVNNRVADARRMVVELKTRANDDPDAAPYLVDAAIALGDHQFESGAYRTAASTYSLAVEAAEANPKGASKAVRDPRWAEFQRANALFELADYDASLPIYTALAESDAPWAAEAEAKAEFARLRQQVRGGRGQGLG